MCRQDCSTRRATHTTMRVEKACPQDGGPHGGHEAGPKDQALDDVLDLGASTEADPAEGSDRLAPWTRGPEPEAAGLGDGTSSLGPTRLRGPLRARCDP